MSTPVAQIKASLETAYDIPFFVRMTGSMFDPRFEIIPDNPDESLFAVEVSFRQRTRLVVEMRPQKYAAALVYSMASASPEKKDSFSQFASALMVEKGARIELSINRQTYDPRIPHQWPNEWKDLYCRITKSPIINEDEEFDPSMIVSRWAVPIFGMFLSLVDIVPINDYSENPLEGAVSQVTTNRYERNPINRQLCLTAHGYSCQICGFNFEDVYGELGKEFIHVHHIVPVSASHGEYRINPVKDLIPVCPNCHAMLHRSDPPIQPENLLDILKSRHNISQ